MTNEPAERLREKPRIDPTMHVYSVHSEQRGSDGARRGRVPATFRLNAWGRWGYECWHCAILDAEEER